MKCYNCIHYNVCGYHIDEETPELTVNECPHGFKHRDQCIMLPVYVGRPVWYVQHWYYTNKVEIKEGKVSMLQQKADKSWKFRVSEGGSVSDYVLADIGNRIFLTLPEAELERDKIIKELHV